MTNEDATPEVLSRVYHALRVPRRRYLIRLLAESGEDTISVRTCARQIAAVEEQVPPSQATGEPYRNVYNSLSQTHLETLSDADLIIYDPDRQTVSPGPELQFAMLILALNHTTYRTLHGQHSTNCDSLRL